jgi:tetratricopeptide (TPR) repeat protein
VQKILYILLFSLLSATCIDGQDLYQIKSFSDELFSDGKYQQALKEYERVLFFDKKNEFNELYLKIASIFFHIQDFENAYRYYDYGLRVVTDDSIKFELILKKTLCKFRQDKYMEALYELLDLPDNTIEFLQAKKNLYLGICCFGLNNYEDSRKYFTALLDSTGILQINSLFDEFSRYNNKFRPGKIELMSKLLPGLGQFYAGNILDGLNSFILLSGIGIYSLITALNYGIVDGILMLSSWFYRYYSGGYTNASKLSEKKIAEKKTEVYSEILMVIENHQKK